MAEPKRERPQPEWLSEYPEEGASDAVEAMSEDSFPASDPPSYSGTTPGGPCRASVVEQRGTHLLVQRDGQFAVVERRDDRVYSVRDSARDGQPDTLEGIAAAATESGWQDETPTRRLFDDLTRRGDDLAKRIW
jgi:hypothetical protein